MNEFSERYCLASIGDVTHISTGKLDANAANPNGEYPFFTCADETLRINSYAFDTEAILLAGNGGFGIKWYTGKFNAYQRTYVIEPKEIYGRYLYYCIKNCISEITSSDRGSTIKYLRLGDITETKIPIAPLDEQKRIADKLDQLQSSVDSCKTRLDAIPVIIKRFLQSVLSAATSGELTAEWRNENNYPFERYEVLLSEIAEDFSYGTSAKSSKEGEVPVLRMGNIQNGKLLWNDLVYTSIPEEIKKYNLQPGDVLFNRTNSPELVGKTAVYKGERKAVFAGYLIRVRCTEKIHPDYLNYCLNSPAGRDYCWQVKTDGVSQSNINAKKLAAFPISLPPIYEQEEIIRRVEDLHFAAACFEARYRAANEQLKNLTQSLLVKAFRGELLPQNQNDEPADKLMDQIRVAKASEATIKSKRKAPGRKPMTKITPETVKDAIRKLPNDAFTFDELRDSLPSDYELLKDSIFTLLSESAPIIQQTFDAEAKLIRFIRVK